MRLLNICAALSGLVALTALIDAAHGFRAGHDQVLTLAIHRMQIAGFIHLGAAAAGLAIANRTGRVNQIGGALILAGAAIFSFTLYGVSLLGTPAALAPVGGIALLIGWALLVFAKPA